MTAGPHSLGNGQAGSLSLVKFAGPGCGSAGPYLATENLKGLNFAVISPLIEDRSKFKLTSTAGLMNSGPGFKMNVT